jgi:hypothetical protein
MTTGGRKLRVLFFDERGETLGSVWLEHGVVRFSNALGKLAGSSILVANDRELTAADGEAFLRALPGQYRSIYFHAELADDGGSEPQQR